MSQSRHQHFAGQVIERHRHDEHQLVYVSRGVLAVHTERGAWIASADRALWIPAHTWHEHRVYGDAEVLTFMFPGQDSPLASDSPAVVAVNPFLRELLIARTEPGLTAAEAGPLQAVLQDRLRRAHDRPLTLPTARDARLAHACRLVTDDLSTPRTIRWLAQHARTSERTLARLFRLEFGITYPQWRTATRVFHAMIHLAEGATVTQTAHRCGWATTSAFVDTFARTMGQTPGTYQRRPKPPGHPAR
ncbi:helix-turn-helix transcriptional regulator [Amycolatopsis sp. PS_44_ISF1]|uniref:AraC family transcriptional regulator n=1 Tax=Amycolatopsis sp. PS_44_ISF1 TaxID=2974917 RepID=UPI0028E080C3|nr:helix-turn-helix transcriptional regulator [Amycolatopsis sp. PS_44_ISF1]MDT8915002.1 helix-turn-helix transcriptional regulator [Amycolatopsis sp. PS_44_ISF1]